MDFEAFMKELDSLKREVDQTVSEEDFKHLKKLEKWGKTCTAFGYATAWVCPNPFSIVALSLGRLCRWTLLAHPIIHQGYDHVPNIPKKYTSKKFAKGPRRYIDWFDWMDPEAWAIEHNFLHHFHLGEKKDPDLVETVAESKSSSFFSKPKRVFAFFGASLCWKAIFYAPSTMKQLQELRNKKAGDFEHVLSEKDLSLFLPFSKKGREIWKKCWLPYSLIQFVGVPSLFLPLGISAVVSASINSILAEVLTNIHSFLLIVPNHAGDDLYRFETPSDGRIEFQLRQIIGSTNYTCGGDLNDFMHGWLNYQIEHHIWPNLTLRQYQRVQPKVKILCEKYGIPYRQESVFIRGKKLFDIFIGKTHMKVAQNAKESIALLSPREPFLEIGHPLDPIVEGSI